MATSATQYLERAGFASAPPGSADYQLDTHPAHHTDITKTATPTPDQAAWPSSSPLRKGLERDPQQS